MGRDDSRPLPVLPPTHRWDAVPSPRAGVHIAHGMAEHGGRYARFARAVHAAGLAVWAHDHRGHGNNATPGIRGHFADSDGWSAVLQDVQDVSAEMARVFEGIPLVLFAHSMGSFMAQALLPDLGRTHAGVILAGTNGPPGVQEAAARALAPVQRAVLGPRAAGRWLKTVVFGQYNRQFAPTRTGADWLSRDPAEVDAYLRDPLCNFAITTQAWMDFLGGKAAAATPAAIARIPGALPLFFIAGTRDPVGENRKGVDRLL